jgi:hypothetical protein
MDPMEAGFIAGNVGRGAGSVREEAVGDAHVDSGVEAGHFLLELGFLADHFVVDESDFVID